MNPKYFSMQPQLGEPSQPSRSHEPDMLQYPPEEVQAVNSVSPFNGPATEVGTPNQFMNRYMVAEAPDITKEEEEEEPEEEEDRFFSKNIKDYDANLVFKNFVETIKSWRIVPQITIQLTSQTKAAAADLPRACGFDVSRDNSLPDTEHCLHGVVLLVEDARTHRERGDLHKTTSYHNRLFNYRPRTHVFSIMIDGRSAYLARWSRAGLRHSEKFDYVRSPSTIADFLHRLERMDHSQRGQDATTRRATTQEQMMLYSEAHAYSQKLLDEGRHVPPYLSKVASPIHEPCCLQISSTSSRGKKPHVRQYVVQRPITEPNAFFGCGTWTYVAWGLRERRLVFVKDTWRDVTRSWEKDVYKYLAHTHGVERLPAILFADIVKFNDRGGRPQRSTKASVTVLDQQSQASDYEPAEPFRYRQDSDLVDDPAGHIPEWTRSHTHCRIVQELTLPLMSVASTRELLEAIYDAFTALHRAYNNGNMLNQHVSSDTIRLDVNHRGILGGWDSDLWMQCGNIAQDTERAFWAVVAVALKRFKWACDETFPREAVQAILNVDAGHKAAIMAHQITQERWQERVLRWLKEGKLMFEDEPLNTLLCRWACACCEWRENERKVGELICTAPLKEEIRKLLREALASNTEGLLEDCKAALKEQGWLVEPINPLAPLSPVKEVHTQAQPAQNKKRHIEDVQNVNHDVRTAKRMKASCGGGHNGMPRIPLIQAAQPLHEPRNVSRAY